MEILKIAEPCPLIDPSQVVVTQGEVLVAEPVLTLQGQRQIDVLRLSHPSLCCFRLSFLPGVDFWFHAFVQLCFYLTTQMFRQPL